MKIVYCIPSLYNPGGMERVLTEKVNCLATKAAFDITIITTEQQGKKNYFKLDKSVKNIDFGLNFNEHFDKNLLIKTFSHYKKLTLYKRKLQQYLIDNKVDICVSLCGKEIDFLTSLKDRSVKMAEIHFSINNRKLFLLARHKGLIWKLLGNIRTWQLKKATQRLKYLVVLTEQDAKEWKFTHDNIVVIPNPTPFLCEDIPNKKSKTVISVGKLDEQKGYDYLLEAWRKVFYKHPDWHLKIFGQGVWHDKLQSYIDEHQMGGQIKLCGVTADVKREYLDSAFYVMSSRYEGLPMVLIEAMTCGLPIVSFDCECGPREIIIHGENGFLVPVSDIKTLGDRINQLIEDILLRNSMSVRAKEYSKKYDQNVIMEYWIKLFNSLI